MSQAQPTSSPTPSTQQTQGTSLAESTSLQSKLTEEQRQKFTFLRDKFENATAAAHTGPPEQMLQALQTQAMANQELGHFLASPQVPHLG